MPSVSASSSNTISPVQSSYDQGADVQSLTGDALLMYCQTRLGDLDNEINMRMGDQKAALARRQAIQSVEVALKKYGDNGPQNQEQWDACEAAISAAQALLPPGDPGIASLEKFRFDIEHQYCRDIAPNPHYPKDGEWKGTIDGLTKMEDDIKGGAEIEMLQLQQLMSQRQTAVQLTTNMLSKLDQTQDSIVKNL
jgi:hypothetical protein